MEIFGDFPEQKNKIEMKKIGAKNNLRMIGNLVVQKYEERTSEIV